MVSANSLITWQCKDEPFQQHFSNKIEKYILKISQGQISIALLGIRRGIWEDFVLTSKSLKTKLWINLLQRMYIIYQKESSQNESKLSASFSAKMGGNTSIRFLVNIRNFTFQSSLKLSLNSIKPLHNMRFVWWFYPHNTNRSFSPLKDLS